MGFSVSGSAAIIFAGMFIAFGMWYSASFDAFERVDQAQQLKGDANLEQQNAAIEISSATWSDSNDEVTVKVVNTGATAIALNDTDVILDNDYETGWRDGADVGGNTDTWLWFPDETLTLTVNSTATPDRVKVVTVGGVADTEVVS